MEAKGVNIENLEELINKTFKTIKEGDLIKGKILKIGEREVYFDLGAKAEGVCPKDEFKNPEELKPGDEITLYVEDPDGPDGFVILSKHKADFELAWDKISDAYENSKTITGKVLRRVKGGLIVDVFGVDAFMPGSQIDVKPVRNMNLLIGKTIHFKLVKVNKERKNIVVSRRAYIEEELDKKRKIIEEKFEEGQIVEGEAKYVSNTGVTIDLGEVEGFIPVSELSTRRVKNAREIIKVGERIKSKVIDKDLERLRVILSLKDLIPEKWEQIANKYPIGTRIKGVVKKILPYGVLIEIEKDVVGFCHISELTWRKIKDPKEVVREGETVEALVLDVDKEKMRIALGVKQTQPDPWTYVEDKFPRGSVVKGTVIGFDNFGAIIDLGDGIEGYLHTSDISWTRKFSKPEEALRIGQKLRLKVMNVDKRARLITLSLKHLRPDPWKEIMKKLTPETTLKAPILRVTEKGVTVEVDKGLEGFVPASHLAKKGNVTENYKEGEEINLKVLKVEPQRKRILLSEREYERIMQKKEIAKYTEGGPARINLGELLKAELEKISNIEEEEEKKEE
jgi:small subunit ribosomal protein S1